MRDSEKQNAVNREGRFLMGKKIPIETKIKYAKLCFENKMSKKEAARHLSGSETMDSGESNCCLFRNFLTPQKVRMLT